MCVCVCVRMLYLLDTEFFFCFSFVPRSLRRSILFKLRFKYSTRAVCFGGVVFSVNFNVDMYLVLRSPISRR